MAFSGITSSGPKEDRHDAYKVEVRLRGPNGDQGRKGEVLMRTKKGLVEGEEGRRGVSQWILYDVQQREVDGGSPLDVRRENG